MRANTPKGATSITHPVIFNMISEAAFTRSVIGLAFSPIMSPAIPTSSAKKMIARILPSAKAAIGLLGTMLIRRADKGIASCTTPGTVAERSTPAPGCRITANIRPIVIAKSVVNMYRPSVITPNEPSFFGSPMAITPETRVKKTNGTTTILMRRTKRSPIHLIETALSPHRLPTMTPSTRANTIRFHRAILNQARNI